VNPAAAYVDFEALKSPLHPALIGILVDRGNTESFEQVVVDERLRPAVVARMSSTIRSAATRSPDRPSASPSRVGCWLSGSPVATSRPP